MVKSPHEALIDQGFTIEYVDPPLTEEEKESLLTKEDKGIIPAPMRQFKDFYDFIAHQNNFYVTFADQKEEGGHMLGSIYRARRAAQRFWVINPELTNQLLDKFKDYDNADAHIDPETWKLLFEAYKEMSELVDVNDYGVTVDGQINKFYLCA